MSENPKSRIAIAVVIACTVTSPLFSEPWTLGEDCGPHELEEAYVRHMKKIEPGVQGYLPVPFPKTNGEVLRNFESEFARLWSDDVGKSTVAEGIKRGTVTYQVLPIGNWSRSRCSDPTRPFRNRKNFLIRVFDSTRGDEIARARANQDGTIGFFAVGAYDRTDFMDVTKATEIVERDGVRVPGRSSLRAGQLVKSNGGLACRDVEPCVAFQTDQGAIVVEKTKFGVRFAVEGVEHLDVSSMQGREFGELVRSERTKGRTAATAGKSVYRFRVIEAKAGRQ